MKMVFVWLLAAVLSIQAFPSTPLQETARLETDIQNGKLTDRTEKAITALLHLGAKEIAKRGYVLEGAVMEDEWSETYRPMFLKFAMSKSRDIGDHKPISDWLAEQYGTLEAILGIEICKKMHLSDIKTFNYAIPVVFRPCSFPMDAVTGERIDEYRRHFSEGEIYYGLAPVTAYWAIYIGCGFGTAGTGYVYICGLASDLGERIFGLVTPRLSDFVFKKACGG